MKTMKKFFTELASSVYDPTFYQKVVVKKTRGQAAKHFMKVALIITAIYAVVAIPLAQKVFDFYKNMDPKINEFSQNFPADLEVTFKDGKTVTNVTQPYYVPVKGDDTGTSLKNFLVIDTNTPYSSAKFTEYSTFAWLTSDTLFYYSNSQSANGQTDFTKIEALPVSKLPQTTINRQTVTEFLHKAEPIIRGIIAVAIPVMVLVIYLVMVGVQLVYFFFLALLIKWLSAMMGSDLDYRASYAVAAYVAGPIIIIRSLLGLVPLSLPVFATTIACLLLAALNLASSKKKA